MTVSKWVYNGGSSERRDERKQYQNYNKLMTTIRTVKIEKTNISITMVIIQEYKKPDNKNIYQVQTNGGLQSNNKGHTLIRQVLQACKTVEDNIQKLSGIRKIS